MKSHRAKGFTLVELVVAISLGLLIMGAGVMIYKQAQDSTTYMTQRTQVQANARAAINQLSQDLNLAGYGLPIGGVALPNAAKFSCANTTSLSCPNTVPTFPSISGTQTLYGVMPMASAGPTLNGKATDQVMIAYVDSSSSFWKDTCSNCGFSALPLTAASVSGSTTTLTFDSATSPAPSDAKWGLKAGDLVLVTTTKGSAVGEVTATPSSNTVTLGGSDAMGLNQAYGTAGSVPNVLNFSSGTENYNSGTGSLIATTVSRLYIVTYYVYNDPLAQASGTSANPTRMYRWVNGDSTQNAPQPVAEEISNLTFTYDLFDSVCNGSLSTNQSSPTAAQVSLIKTVNANVTAASTLNTNAVPGQKIQQIPLSTTVSPRNLSYFDSYSSTKQGSC